MVHLVLLLVDILRAAEAVEILLHSPAESAMADQVEAVQARQGLRARHLAQQTQVAEAVEEMAVAPVAVQAL
jgi:hypothetical protein